jgi:hypothetical protein
VTPLSRLRSRTRTWVSGSPTVYLPIARRRYPGPSPQVVDDTTELVIDGYTRCASTHVVYAFQLAQQHPVRVAHHLHAPAQLVAAARLRLPTLAVVREPRGAVLSQVVREPDVDLRDALVAYARFYEQLGQYRDAMVVGDFPELIADLGGVVGRLNRRFGTLFAEPRPDHAAARECTELVTARSSLAPVLLGFESGLVGKDQLRAARAETSSGVGYGGVPAAAQELWVPSPARERAKAALARSWDQAPARLRRRAWRAYRDFVASPVSPA